MSEVAKLIFMLLWFRQARLGHRFQNICNPLKRIEALRSVDRKENTIRIYANECCAYVHKPHTSRLSANLRIRRGLHQSRQNTINMPPRQLKHKAACRLIKGAGQNVAAWLQCIEQAVGDCTLRGEDQAFSRVYPNLPWIRAGARVRLWQSFKVQMQQR